MHMVILNTAVPCYYIYDPKIEIDSQVELGVNTSVQFYNKLFLLSDKSLGVQWRASLETEKLSDATKHTTKNIRNDIKIE